MNKTVEINKFAKLLADRLTDEFSIGNCSTFCEEVDWDNATLKEIEDVIKEELNHYED
jgi:hypothetical protein